MAAAACCFLLVRLMRASEAMWRVMWVFCQAHLLVVLESEKMQETGTNDSNVEMEDALSVKY